MAQSNIDQLKEIIVVGAGKPQSIPFGFVEPPTPSEIADQSIDFYVQVSSASPLH